jgi:hypothetical protein
VKEICLAFDKDGKGFLVAPDFSKLLEADSTLLERYGKRCAKLLLSIALFIASSQVSCRTVL